MLFAIALFLLVLSPLFIPIGVTVAHEFGGWRDGLAASRTRLARKFLRARQFRPATELIRAAA